MGKRHIPHPKAIKVAQCGQTLFDDVATFNAHQTDELAVGDRSANLRNAVRNDDVMGMPRRHVVNRIDSFKCFSNRRPGCLPLPHIDRPKLNVESTLAYSRQVHVAVSDRMPFPKVPTGVLKFGRGIRVSIDDDRIEVEVAHLGHRACAAQKASRDEKADRGQRTQAHRTI